ncbi:MAG: hypothetical protein GY703_15505 [Gammaproteobacteria bacterium]|nr:hypothetical protein [Gammaproteobacteria bacterium]
MEKVLALGLLRRAPRAALAAAVLIAGASGVMNAHSEVGEPWSRNHCTWDVDGDGEMAPDSDGVVISRFLSGFIGEVLVADAVGENATRTSADQIETYLQACKEMFDIDGDSLTNALTDGILIQRHLTGLEGEALIDRALADGATRVTAAQVGDVLGFYDLPGAALALRAPVNNPILLPGMPASFQPLTRYAGEDPVHFALLEGPEGMEMDSAYGFLFWTPPASAEGSTQTVRIRASAGDLRAEISFSVYVSQGTPMATEVDGNSVQVSESGSLQGLSLALASETYRLGPSGDDAALAAQDVQIFRLAPDQLPALPPGVTRLTDAFRVTPLVGSDPITIAYPWHP